MILHIDCTKSHVLFQADEPLFLGVPHGSRIGGLHVEALHVISPFTSQGEDWYEMEHSNAR